MGFQIFTILLAAQTVCFGAFIKGSDNNGHFDLLILHNNDIHARYDETSRGGEECTQSIKAVNKCYGGVARVAHVVKEAKRKAKESQGPPVLHLNAGDTYTGTAWHRLFQGEAASDFINALDIDAMSLGNHEFDDGTRELSAFIKNVTKTTPVLCANLELNKEPKLAREPNLKNSTVLIVNGHKIGIIGYLTPTTKHTSKPNNVEYIDEIVAIKEETKKLQEEGVNILIALGHSGYAKDLEIAKEVEGIDLVIGGHTNTLLCNGQCPDPDDNYLKNGAYPTNVTQASGRVVPVVQAYYITRYIGELHLSFDLNGEIIKAFGKPVLLDATIPQDPTVLSMIEEYKRRPKFVEAHEVVGKTSVILYRDNCNTSECNIGNLITDAMVYHYANNYKGEHWTDAPIAVLQFGGIKSSIIPKSLPANVNMMDLMTVMPFKNNLQTVNLNGTLLLRMLEHSVAEYKTNTRGFLQVSGLKVVYNVNKPTGSRVVKAEARCSACEVPKYYKVEERGVYKVISQGFIAKGGDGFEMLGKSRRTDLGYTELLCTKYFMRNLTLVFPEIEGRITVLSEAEPKINSNDLPF